jgi:hypothetical protein
VTCPKSLCRKAPTWVILTLLFAYLSHPAPWAQLTWCFFSVSNLLRECRELSASRNVARSARSISALWYAPTRFPHRNNTIFAASCG